MRILAVDDERLALLALERAIREAEPGCALTCFVSPAEALAHAAKEAVDVAFLDIEMDSMNGLGLAKRLKDIRGESNIVFVTGHSQYAVDAFSLRASGYLRKPVTAEDIHAELNNLRHPLPDAEKGVRIQCFGNFEIFVDGKPVHFHRSKAKELLAYLVSRSGAGVSKKELAGILWEDGEYNRITQSYLQTLIVEMLRALREAGAECIIIRKWNSLSVDTSLVDCDYYNFEKGEPKAVNAYRGEFMANYPWAEFVENWLDKKGGPRCCSFYLAIIL
ncbi:response regulator [Desulfovibrio sp. OttesenSCG-928-I05]|nr:response regulator [Desulfovibrio sp. OttesenSCG-928-I05]